MANSGVTYDLNSLSFEVGKGGSSDLRGYFIRSSVDNFATDLINVTLPTGSQQAPSLASVDLSSYKNISATTFRFYVFAPTDNTSVDFRNIQLTSAAGAVPEPLTILGAMTAAGFGAGFKRKLAKSKKDQKDA